MDKRYSVIDSAVKSIDEKERTLTALVSTNTRDRMNEVLEPKGADLSKFKKNPVVLFGHRYSEPPIGKALWIKKTAEGILSKVQFATSQFAQEVFDLYKGGFMNAFSVGFIPKKWVDGEGDKEPSTTYTDWELIEYSAVPVPANPDALALALSKGVVKDKKLKEIFETQEEAIKKLGDDDDEKPDGEPPDTSEQEALRADLTETKEQNSKLLEQIEALGKQINELKWKLYSQSIVPEAKPKTLSEMTGDELIKTINEQIAGVIREVTGKVS